MIIDIHAHAIDPYVLNLARNRVVVTGFGERPMGPRDSDGTMTDPEVQIAHMDSRGIDMHVLSLPGVISGTSWADARTDLELCQRVNNTIAGWVRAHPKRFAGTYVLPLQDLHLALPEAQRCVEELGLNVANLPANIDGIYLGDFRLRPLWDGLRTLKSVAWIHPDGVKDAWFQRYALWNSLGQSIEEAKVMASLMYEGVFDQYPDVPIIIAHGGGYFPHYMGRLDRNVTNMPHSMANISKPPSQYLRSVYYDTCVYDPDVLGVLAQRVGADRLIMGSDYPVNMLDPLDFLKTSGKLTDAEIPAVAGTTLAGLLKLG
jgi:aminocarboxymuconate-semialdehyde decarboxylase